MTDERVIGMNYFDHQFLRREDFETAQDYHVDRLRQHNRLLHQPGIVAADELTVNRTGDRSVEINLGRAIDGWHREVVLRRTDGATAELPIGVSVKRPDGETVVLPLVRIQTDDRFTEEELPVTGAALPVDLSPLPANADPVYLTIRAGTKATTPSTDPGITGDTRLVERPVIEVSTSLPSGAQILLARVNRNADGTINGNPDSKGREYTGAWLAPDSVTTNHIQNSAVTGVKLANGAVTSAKIANEAVTSAKIADGAVTSAKIAKADGSSGQDIGTGTGVKTDHLQDGAVTEAKLADGAVTSDKIAKGAIVGAKITNGAVTRAKIANGAINSTKIADGAVTDEKVKDNALLYTKLRGERLDVEISIAADGTESVNLGASGPFRLVSVQVTDELGSVDWHFRSVRIEELPIGRARSSTHVVLHNPGGSDVTARVRAYILAEPS
jgi:hypothetical protein